MWSFLCLGVLLLAASGGGAPGLPTSAAEMETFEPERRVFTVLDLLTAINSRLREQDDRLTELAAQVTGLRRRLPEYPVCEVVTVEQGRQFRLVGDAGCRRGRLQWRIRGFAQWHQLCDRTEWSAADAAVACLSLGFHTSSPGAGGELLGSAEDGHARGLDITCEGFEKHLWQCRLERETFHTDGCPADTTPVTVSCDDG